jgi:signal transduction histidine kinase
LAVYSRSGCFAGRELFRLYEDSRGDVWIGTVQREGDTLFRWKRNTDSFDCFGTRSIVGSRTAPTAFLEDPAGNVWIGFGGGQLARYRNGRFECTIDCGEGSQGAIEAMVLDSRRRVWIATARAGLLRIDNPSDPDLRVVRFTMAEGLSSNLVRAVVHDRFGRIYVGTDHGVDILEETTGRMRHFGIEDGLPHPYVTAGWSDRQTDTIWFGTLNGLARFTPKPRLRDAPLPDILLDGLRVSGVSRPLSAAGERRLEGLVLQPDQKDIQIDFVGLPRRASSTLKFQYRESPIGSWSVPTANRSLVLAGLSPGDYRYEIRAVDTSRVSSASAVVSFRVLAPVYRRPWFLTASGSLVLTFLVVVYRVRVVRFAALERQRKQIAMDLHDEMGSQLGSIGLLADLAAEPTCDRMDRAELLAKIGEAASEMGSTLNDFVWSLREGEMTLESLARQLSDRGRRLFPDPGRTLEVVFPHDWPKVTMALGARRNAFLVGLEALHNAARHSCARKVVLKLHPSGRRWQLVIEDDGTGIQRREASPAGSGFGFETMRRRAEEIGASLDIDSEPGRGTRVTLTFEPRAETRRRPLFI